MGAGLQVALLAAGEVQARCSNVVAVLERRKRRKVSLLSAIENLSISEEPKPSRSTWALPNTMNSVHGQVLMMCRT